MLNDENQKGEGERLQKVLAHAGVASRRAAEALIIAGKVKVNGKVVKELGTKVSSQDEIFLEDKPVYLEEKLSYFILYKPTGVITSVKDPRGRKTVIDLIGMLNLRLYPVGRLDYDTSGLLLLTNDGELAFRLTHPRYGVEKTYLVGVKNKPSPKILLQLAQGVDLEEGRTSPAKVYYRGINSGLKHTLHLVEITIHEGRNRQVRRMFAKVGYPVEYLKRIQFGPLKLDKKIKPGEYRQLTPEEIIALRSEVGL